MLLEQRPPGRPHLLVGSVLAGRVRRRVHGGHPPALGGATQRGLEPGTLLRRTDAVRVEADQEQVAEGPRVPPARHAERPHLPAGVAVLHVVVAEQRAEPGAAEDVGIGPEDRLVEQSRIAVRVRVVPQQHEAVEGAGPADRLRHGTADRVARAHVTDERQAGAALRRSQRRAREALCGETDRYRSNALEEPTTIHPAIPLRVRRCEPASRGRTVPARRSPLPGQAGRARTRCPSRGPHRRPEPCSTPVASCPGQLGGVRRDQVGSRWSGPVPRPRLSRFNRTLPRSRRGPGQAGSTGRCSTPMRAVRTGRHHRWRPG